MAIRGKVRLALIGGYCIKFGSMDGIIDLLKITLPALFVVFLAAYFFDRMTRRNQDQNNQDRSLQREKILFPLQIQAYERLTILLERITPSPLVMRVNEQQMQSAQLQLALLQSIRDEFEHNVSMQIYVSDALWEQIVAARDEAAGIIQRAGSQVTPTDPSIRLCQVIFDLERNSGNRAIQTAMRTLKGELRDRIQ